MLANRPTTEWRCPTIVRALDPEVVDAVWAAVAPMIPPHPESHPLGRHRRRKSDFECSAVLLVGLVTGCSWETGCSREDAERPCGGKVSDTTVRSRRDEWRAAGVFPAVGEQAVTAYDIGIGLALGDVSADGSLHKSPCGGEGAGPNPTDRGKLGWKRSILCDEHGTPLGVAIDGANRVERTHVWLSPPSSSTGLR